MNNDWLAELAPEHLPLAPSWWPPAAGWWAVGSVWRSRPLQRSWCGGVSRAAGCAARHWRNCGACDAREPDLLATASGIQDLLRRYALALFGHEQVARLSGRAWLDFLSLRGGESLAGHRRPGAAGRELPRKAERSRRPRPRRLVRGRRELRAPRRAAGAAPGGVVIQFAWPWLPHFSPCRGCTTGCAVRLRRAARRSICRSRPNCNPPQVNRPRRAPGGPRPSSRCGRCW